MAKKYDNILTETKSLLKMVKTLNESINFEDEDFDVYQDMEGYDEPMRPMSKDETSDMQYMDEDSFTDVDTIREIALKGMVKLCHQPNDPTYEALKKIFQFCDKANEKKDEESLPKKS